MIVPKSVPDVLIDHTTVLLCRLMSPRYHFNDVGLQTTMSGRPISVVTVKQVPGGGEIRTEPDTVSIFLDITA